MADAENFDGNFSAEDAAWMRRALELARLGIGLASPNPMVGCVVVKNGEMVGEGFHRYELRDHAEVVALRMAGYEARAATAYVTLEPCSHTGRTAPCADALIAAGVARVIAATVDPNSAVSGAGLARLRAAGIDATCGLLQDEARAINNAFAKFIRGRFPFVTLKAGVSIDGMIAPKAGDREERDIFWLTGEAARAEVQRMRHAADAIVTGIGTVLADDPLLTDRSGLERRRRLMRVVLDSKLEMPLDAKMLRAVDADVLIFCGGAADAERRIALERLGVRVVHCEMARPELRDVLSELGTRGVTHLLVEAGSRLNGAFLREDLVDEVVVFRAPISLGGDAVPFADGGVTLDAVEKRIVQPELEMFGEDICIRGLLHDPWAVIG